MGTRVDDHDILWGMSYISQNKRGLGNVVHKVWEMRKRK